MSTVHYDADDLGNLVYVMAMNKFGSAPRAHYITTAAHSIAEYAKANHVAAKMAGCSDEPCVTLELITEEAQALLKERARCGDERIEEAARVVRQMRYNLDGHATVDAMHAIIDAMQCGPIARVLSAR